VLAKVPVEHQGEVKAAYWAIFDPTGEPPGERSVDDQRFSRSAINRIRVAVTRQCPPLMLGLVDGGNRS
jgi:hypothetical protein